MEQVEISATIDDKGKRVDKFIFENIDKFKKSVSRTRIKSIIESGEIVNINNNEFVKNCSQKVKGDEVFLISFIVVKQDKIIPQDVDFDIIFEDDDMLVVNKPTNLATHPSNPSHKNTLVHGLLYKLGDRLSDIGGVLRPGIVHRLDRDTSGLMVVAKNDLAHHSLSDQIKNRDLKRQYLALCYGCPEAKTGIINKNIDRSRNNRLKMQIVKNSGKNAITNYKVIKSYFNNLLAMVECKLDTGRTHQIRVHMNEIGHPLIGDQLYNNKRRYLGSLGQEMQQLIDNFPRQFLHSYKIAFFHPRTKELMEFESKLPADLQDLLDKIDQFKSKLDSEFN